MKNLIVFIFTIAICTSVIAQDTNNNNTEKEGEKSRTFKDLFTVLYSKDLNQKVDDLINSKDASVDTIKKIEKLTSKIVDLSEIKEDQLDGVCRTWYIPVSCDNKINSLVSALEPILFDGVLIDYSSLIEELEDSIEELNSEKKALNLIMSDPLASNDEKKVALSQIKDVNAQIESNKKNIDRLQKHLQKKLNSLGIKLSVDQVDQLTTRIDGNDFAKSIAIFDVTKQITLTLGDLMKLNSFDKDTAAEYYGVYLVLAEILGYTQKQMIYNIDKVYLIKLDELKAEAYILIEQMEAKKFDAPADLQENYENNIRVSRNTISGVDLYKKVLLKQKKLLNDANSKTSDQIDNAYFTYKSYINAANVENYIKEFSANIDSLIRQQVPEIIPFDNSRQRALFQQISEQYREMSD